MKTILNSAFAVLFLAMASLASAQAGQYDVRFNLNSFDCNNFQLFIDVEVKATSSTGTFNMSDQNYRFSFNRSGVPAIIPPIDAPQTNPPDRSFFIQQELQVSGFVAVDGTVSFYDAHTLTGSIDTVMSYNVKLAGGDGYPVDETTWIKVGRLRVNLLGPNSCVEFEWHTHDPADFPPTFIGEKFNGLLYAVSEGNYENFSVCLDTLCNVPLPIELAYFDGVDLGCAVDLEWETITETNNDYFRIEKSTDGSEYRTIATVEGVGTSLSPQKYAYTDNQVGILNYYRLIQVDFDGTETEHETVIVRSSCFDDTSTGISEIFPNPVGQGDIISMKFYTDRLDTDAFILITDVMGRTIDQVAIGITQGPNTLTYDPTRLASGAYFVQVMGNDWYSTPQKFVKVNP